MFMDRPLRKRLLYAGFCFFAVLFVAIGGQVVASNQVTSAAPLPARKPVVSLQVAMALPDDLSALSHQSNLSSKNIFSDRQARLYREIFILQEIGDIESANKKISRLKNPVLLGHVLAERYLHPTAYDASFKELKNWLDRYADHPQASNIYKLAFSKKPAGYALKKLERPTRSKKVSGNIVAHLNKAKIYHSKKKRTASQTQRVRKLRKDIKRHAVQSRPTLALNALSNDYAVQFIDDVEYDRLRATIAAGYLYAGKIDKAISVSKESIGRSGTYVPLAGWVLGLSYWQKQDYQKASQAFETAATSPYSSGWMISAAAYWASRAHMRVGNTKLVGRWLELSATYSRTFYGLIAARALGETPDFNWSMPSLTRSRAKFVEDTPHGKRAAALIQVGRLSAAEKELSQISISSSIKKRQALMAYANYYKLPALSMQMGNSFYNAKGEFYDSALYPITAWQPQGGYRIDRALIHAVARQESRFKTKAANPSGAKGLMQLMPATAKYVAGEGLYDEKNGQRKLLNPSINLEIGQAYIEKLLNHPEIGQDLFSLAIAYNAGPGNLSKWKKQHSHIKDPLMFIETIPYAETRAFVERVMSNYWIYRMRLGQETPSLDDVAKGKWARYKAQDKGSAKLASAN